MTFAILISPDAARQIQRERAWLYDHRGVQRADAFEAELAHALDLLQECADMGPPSPWSKEERRVFLRRSRYHIYYRPYRETLVIVVMRIRHEKQRPLG